MALFRWHGTASGAWNTGLNWQDGADVTYPAGRYPGSVALVYDQVWLDSSVSGKNSLNGAYNPATGGEDIIEFKVMDIYDGTIGTSTAWLYLDMIVNASELRIDGDNAGGHFYIAGAGGNGITRSRIYQMKAGTTCYLSGTLTNIDCARGTVQIGYNGTPPTPPAVAATVSGILNVNQVTSVSDVSLAIENTTFGANSQCFQDAGTVTCESDVIALTVSGGNNWTQDGDITTLRITDGKVTWDSGDIAGAILLGGILDAAQSDVARTLTSVQCHPGSNFYLDNGSFNITLGELLDLGGTYDLPYGCRISSLAP